MKRKKLLLILLITVFAMGILMPCVHLITGVGEPTSNLAIYISLIPIAIMLGKEIKADKGKEKKENDSERQ